MMVTTRFTMQVLRIPRHLRLVTTQSPHRLGTLLATTNWFLTLGQQRLWHHLLPPPMITMRFMMQVLGIPWQLRLVTTRKRHKPGTLLAPTPLLRLVIIAIFLSCLWFLTPLSDLVYAGMWFAPSLTRFRQISADTSWQALVTNWAQYEMLSPPDGVSSSLSCLLFCFMSGAEVAHSVTPRGGSMVAQAKAAYWPDS
jgi:hypothetical protein